ncbi:PREDICTED: F-box/LRR-repeat/kelch-repeat protein At2g29770-like [Camelina sativa]|uniref:F-box/LRR-repeat/kelch-repeat protein At2g29770-like n=1 Tax=Camelina sativa TaxID=90675 RepID=A0ABM0WP19_CAMSA|nr:PREDICTED: F-box/LRR-repeat/kelch-repeat protein At2g29770-like [Camelina sativa]
MALISEISDDASNGGDPRKNPQEEVENQNENPKEEDQEVEKLAPVTLYIPEGLVESILLLVERCNYPKLSLFSRSFHHVISSPELYQRRSQLGLTEPVLYALIRFRFPRNRLPCWYILNRNVPRNISLRLTEVRSLPPMNLGSAVVTIGYEMYVIGGDNGRYRSTSDVLLIDCRFHTRRSLPRMQRSRYSAAAGVIDGKIYVIGGCEQRDDNWVEVFDTDTQTWSSVPVPGPFPGPFPIFNQNGAFMAYIVMQERIYIMDLMDCFAYEQRQGILHHVREFECHQMCHNGCCVVEDLLYSIDPLCLSESPIVACDPNDFVWRPVVGEFFSPNLNYYECKLANICGNLMVIGPTKDRQGRQDVWCVEIVLKRLEGGEIQGKVVSRSLVLKSVDLGSIDLCRSTF